MHLLSLGSIVELNNLRQPRLEVVFLSQQAQNVEGLIWAHAQVC